MIYKIFLPYAYQQLTDFSHKRSFLGDSLSNYYEVALVCKNYIPFYFINSTYMQCQARPFLSKVKSGLRNIDNLLNACQNQPHKRIAQVQKLADSTQTLILQFAIQEKLCQNCKNVRRMHTMTIQYTLNNTKTFNSMAQKNPDPEQISFGARAILRQFEDFQKYFKCLADIDLVSISSITISE